MELEKAVEQVYRGRERMIIIGLTGRTGSGCSKVAEILQTAKFSELDLPESKTREYNDANERKDKVIKDFMEVDGHWKRFDVIEMSSIILASVLEQGIGEFVRYLDSITLENEKSSISIGEKEKLIESIQEISYMFDEAQKYPLETNRTQNFDWDGYYEFYTNTIREYKISFKNI